MRREQLYIGEILFADGGDPDDMGRNLPRQLLS